MKKKGEFLLILGMLWSVIASAQICKFDSFYLNHLIHANSSSFKTESTDSIQLAPSANYEVTYHRMEISVNPAFRFIHGNVTTYFKPISALENKINFDLSSDMIVDSVLFHHQLVTIFSHHSDILSLSISPISPFDSVTIYYKGIPPNTGFGSFNLDTSALGKPVLWTLSEPYGARDWWPCKMTLTDKIDSLDMFFTVPIGNKVGANGLLQSSIDNGNGTVTHHWKHRYPIAPYLIGMAVHAYEEFLDTVQTNAGNVLVQNYCFAENLENWKISKDYLPKFIQFYSEKFGAYPFIKEKYGHAQFKWGGGMEHQTMSFMVNVGFELSAHELAHQWFGDKITCHSWKDLWLNEGFATYLSGLCYENFAPQYWMAFKSSRLNGATNTTGKIESIWVDDTSQVSRLFDSRTTYSKGAYVLHMLRWMVGDVHFFNALKKYIQLPSSEYGFTETEKLKTVFEAESNLNLTRFFTEWVYGKGFPSYNLTWSQNPKQLFSYSLSQTTADSSVKFYEMPVPVHLIGTAIDTTIIISHFQNEQAGSIPLNFKIDSVEIDPTLWILSTHNTVNKVPDLNQEFSIKLFPVPASRELILWYDAAKNPIQQTEIWNVLGEKIVKLNFQNQFDYEEIDVQNLASGVYYLRLFDNEKWRIFKFIKN